MHLRYRDEGGSGVRHGGGNGESRRFTETIYKMEVRLRELANPRGRPEAATRKDEGLSKPHSVIKSHHLHIQKKSLTL